jgi:alpha-beta hydrolase superfamily lysophospholipase
MANPHDANVAIAAAHKTLLAATETDSVLDEHAPMRRIISTCDEQERSPCDTPKDARQSCPGTVVKGLHSDTIIPMPIFKEIAVSLPCNLASYARIWRPEQPGRGAALYHHGIQSHCGWYEESATALSNAGFHVLQVDRRGSGRNEIDRGHADSAEQLIADARAARDELRRRSGFDEYHVVGVSWGGKLAVAAYVDDPTGVRSLSLVTPGLFPRIGVSKAEMARIGFAMLYETRSLFDIPLNDAGLFTANPHWQEFINNDPLTLRQCTAGFYYASRRMDRVVGRLPQSPPVPIHLFVAEDERIVDNEKTIAFIRSLNWPATRITTYASARHSLEFENDPSVYYRDLAGFIASAQG